MAIQKYRSGSMIDDMMPQTFSSVLDRLFSDSVNSRNMMASFTPHVDTCENEDGFEIEVSLPGLKQEDVNIDFQEGRLTISGERKFSEEKKSRKYHRIENQYGAFSRSFYLPDIVDPEKIEAEFIDGVLRILVPKDTRKTMKHQIKIKGTEAKKETSGQPEKNPGEKGQKARTDYHHN